MENIIFIPNMKQRAGTESVASIISAIQKCYLKKENRLFVLGVAKLYDEFSRPLIRLTKGTLGFSGKKTF